MGLSGKPQVTEHVIAGIPLRAPLKPIYTNPGDVDNNEVDSGAGTGTEEEFSTTPTSEEARIPVKLTCPAPPRKRKSSLKCNYSGVREFFTPPDLESVFYTPC